MKTKKKGKAAKKQPQHQPANFPSFPKLPIEIRLKIWKLCLPGPRVVQYSGYEQGDDGRTKFTPNPLLGVCGESRELAWKKYGLNLETRRFGIDPEEDTIAVDVQRHGEFVAAHLLRCLGSVKHVAVVKEFLGPETWLSLQITQLGAPYIMACLPGLQTMTLVVHDSRACPGWKLHGAVGTLVDPQDVSFKSQTILEFVFMTLEECVKVARAEDMKIGNVELRVKMMALDGKQCCTFGHKYQAWME